MLLVPADTLATPVPFYGKGLGGPSCTHFQFFGLVLCGLRDDLVFFIFLYQLWLYPTDKTRPNEYGIAYEK